VKPVMDPSQPGPERRETAWPVIDGHLFREPPLDVFTRGEQFDVPLLTGSTMSEGALFGGVPSLRAFIDEAKAEYGANAQNFLDLYPASSDAAASAVANTALGDRRFVAQNWKWARLHAQAGRAETFYYRFNRVPPAPELKNIGAFHTSDIPYVFQAFGAYKRWPWQPWDRELSDAMSSYWVNFARSGNPNGTNSPTWPSFNPRREGITFAEDISVAPVTDSARLAFWEDRS
jgi:para-nitrobenzyl esterase